VGFLVRPLGGVIFGHFSDKYGRRPILMATLLLMSFATHAIGMLPTYNSIGIVAPILLLALRMPWAWAPDGILQRDPILRRIQQRPAKLTFTDPENIRELARRGEAWNDSESRQMLEHAIETGRGGVYLEAQTRSVCEAETDVSATWRSEAHGQSPESPLCCLSSSGRPDVSQS
jgi:hypothetical protein